MQHLEPLRRVQISTRTFPEDKRLAMWREVYGRSIAGVDIEPIGDAPFRADATFSPLPGVRIAAGSHSPAHVRVTRELARQGGDVILLGVLRAGIATKSQFGTELNCRVGGASLLSSADPYTATMRTDGSFLTLALPRRSITALVPNVSAAFGPPIASDNAPLLLLLHDLDRVLDAGAALPRISRARSAAASARRHRTCARRHGAARMDRVAKVGSGRGSLVPQNSPPSPTYAVCSFPPPLP